MTSIASRRSANPLPSSYPTHDVGVQTRREHITPPLLRVIRTLLYRKERQIRKCVRRE